MILNICVEREGGREGGIESFSLYPKLWDSLDYREKVNKRNYYNLISAFLSI